MRYSTASCSDASMVAFPVTRLISLISFSVKRVQQFRGLSVIMFLNSFPASVIGLFLRPVMQYNHYHDGIYRFPIRGKGAH